MKVIYHFLVLFIDFFLEIFFFKDVEKLTGDRRSTRKNKEIIK